MPGFTGYTLRAAATFQWGAGEGLLRVTNLDPLASVTVTVYNGAGGPEYYVLQGPGDSIACDLSGVASFTIESSAYPVAVLFLFGRDPTAELTTAQGIIPGVFGLAGHGPKLIAATGTPVPIASSSTPCKVVILKARAANLGTVYLGRATVTADESATGGLQLAPGDMLTFTSTDLSTIYVNGTAGDGVTFAYWA